MLFLEGPMAGPIIKERQKDALREAAHYRLVRQSRSPRRKRLSRYTCAALSWMGHLLVSLGRWLLQQGVPQGATLKGTAADRGF